MSKSELPITDILTAAIQDAINDEAGIGEEGREIDAVISITVSLPMIHLQLERIANAQERLAAAAEIANNRATLLN